MPPEFHTFQRMFARYLRDPHHAPRPSGISARQAAVYQSLVLSNVNGFLDTCFPICHAVLGASRWQRLQRTFFRDWPLHTPWFRDIPQEFVRYLAVRELAMPLPRWLFELAHYEWAELAVDVMEVWQPDALEQGDLLAATVVLNPAMLLLDYAWPVHRIGLQYRPRKPEATHLVIYRDAEERVKFSQLSPLAAQLLARLVAKPQTGLAALQQVMSQLPHIPHTQQLLFGRELLETLQQQGIVLGSLPAHR